LLLLRTLLSAVIDALVDGRYLLHPSPPFLVFQIQNRVVRPMEVEGHEGYLLVQRS
jgi:hypothetical protein